MHYTRGPSYYANFAAWVAGGRSDRAYEDYFDRRVVHARTLEQTLEGLRAEDETVFIWGEYPWVYAMADVEPSTRYMTSFYVLLLPELSRQLEETLQAEKPRFIVVMSDARPNLKPPSPVIDERWRNANGELERLLARDYRLVSSVGRAKIFTRASAGSSSTGVIVDAPPAEAAPR
jgi:hypothetical protein